MTAAEFRATFGKKKGNKSTKIRTEAPEVAKMETWLKYSGIEYIKEYKFHPKRKWRADFYLPQLNILAEYEGLNSEKSGHTTLVGYSLNCEKYNAAALMGFKVLRYTTINYREFFRDVEHLMKVQIKQ